MTTSRLACLLAAMLLGGCNGILGTGGDYDLAVPGSADLRHATDGPACNNTPTSCGESGACVDCTGDVFGSACVQGGCGCNSPVDCSGGRTCMDNRCVTACTQFMPCTKGCCAGAWCAPGTAPTACGRDGSACLDCTQSSSGHACLAGGRCGCTQSSDCPALSACNRATGQCEPGCSMTQPCSAGCCSAAMGGTCLDGRSNKACGADGMLCSDCTNTGLDCSGVVCGCTKSADCPVGQACDTKTRKCTMACGPNQPCNGGCCQAGSCVAGTDNAACGSSGAACSACTNGTPTCVKGACAARCGGMGDGTCDGGTCCLAGQCVPGNAQKSCGFRGACTDCSLSRSGTRCLAPMMSTSWVCGCAAKEDCPAANPNGGIGGYACDLNVGACINQCGLPGVTQCNGGCCSGQGGQCRPGNADLACGNNGGYCNNCGATCSPGPFCNLNTGLCGCTMARGQCNLNVVCSQGGAARYGCNLTTNSCCVPGFYGYKDNGNPPGCCSGASQNGVCTCFPDGTATGNPANPWACCSLEVDGMGKCKCLANGVSAEFLAGAGGVASACCSNRLSGINCVCSPAGGSCQNNSGCCSGMCTIAGGVGTCK